MNSNKFPVVLVETFNINNKVNNLNNKSFNMNNKQIINVNDIVT